MSTSAVANLGKCALTVLRGISRSSSHREMTPALLDLWLAALQGVEEATFLVTQGALGCISAVLRAPQFSGAAAEATVPGALLEMRRAALMALATLTVDNFAASASAAALGLLRDVCDAMGQHKDDADLQMWGCGAIANMLRLCSLPQTELEAAATTVAQTLQTSSEPSALCAAVIATRVIAATHPGLVVVIAHGLKDLVALVPMRASEAREALGTPPAAQAMVPGVEIFGTLQEDVMLTLACINRVEAQAAAVCGCSIDSEEHECLGAPPRTVDAPLPRPFVLCHTCSVGAEPFVVCAKCAPNHASHALSPIMFDNVACSCGLQRKCRQASL